MKKLLLLFALLSAPAVGQVHSDIATQNTQGNWVKAIPGAIVYLCNVATSDADCLVGTGAVQLYTDQTLSTTTTQPVTADSNGNYTLFATPAVYKQCVKGVTSFCQKIAVPSVNTTIVPSITCPGAINGALAAWLDSVTLGCTNLAYTDFAGGLFSQFYQALGPHNGEVWLTSDGVVSASAVPANTIALVVPNVVPTPYRLNFPPAPCTDGQSYQQLSHSTDASGTYNAFLNCLTPSAGGGGTQFQVNTVNLLNCTGSVCPLQNLKDAAAVYGFATTFTNSSGGIIQAVQATPYTKASDPTAPTLTPTNPGSTHYTYGVAGCEDPGCTRHSALVTTATVTGNATISGANPILLSAYADTLYGYRFYVICRTASSGSPASVGVIGSGAWKKFSDNGITADGTTCGTTYATNNTKLDDHCLGGNPSIANAALSVPCGIDTPPASPNALDDEGTGGTFAPGDTNSPFWTWVNQNSATSAYTGGMITLTSPHRAATDNLNCLVQTAPATPYTFTALFYEDISYTNGSGAASTVNFQPGMMFRESGTSKLMTWGGQAHTTNVISALLTEWTNTTTQNGTYPVSANGIAMNPSCWRIQNDGTNINFSSSTDCVNYVQQFSQAKNAFFTTAPDQVGFCVDNNAATSILGVDWWRRTQ